MSVCPFCCTSQGSFVTMGHNGDGSEGVPVCTSCRNTMEDLFESDTGRCTSYSVYPSTSKDPWMGHIVHVCPNTAVVDQRRGQTPYIRIKLCAACFCKRVSASPERAAAIHRVCGTS